jgi:hypothetical protein
MKTKRFTVFERSNTFYDTPRSDWPRWGEAVVAVYRVNLFGVLGDWKYSKHDAILAFFRDNIPTWVSSVLIWSRIPIFQKLRRSNPKVKLPQDYDPMQDALDQFYGRKKP